MKKLWNYILAMWQPAGMLVIGTLIVLFFYTYRIGSLVDGPSLTEIANEKSSQTVQAIVNNPINAPYKVLRYTTRFLHNGISSERMVSGLIAGLSILLFNIIVKKFCSRYAAIFATLMFATSTSLLANGRLATPNILLLMLLVLLAGGYYLRFSKHRERALLVTSIILPLALYVPGMIYFILGGAIWQYRNILKENKKINPKFIIICMGVIFTLLTPLLYGFLRHPEIWREYFGLPAHLPTVFNFLKSFLAVPYGIIVAAPENPIYRLGRQPLLDVFSGIMLILGCFTLFKRYKLDRLVLFLTFFIVAAFYTAISGNYENSFVLLPFIYLCVAIGMSTLLEQWRKVFPLNPLARGAAVGIMSIAVLISVNFQVWRYFVAWPHNSETRAVFTQK